MTNLYYAQLGIRPVAGSYTLPFRWMLPLKELRDQQVVITFSGTAAAPVCSVTVSQVAHRPRRVRGRAQPRDDGHIVPANCRAIVKVILSHGGNLMQSVPIVTETDLSPLGQ